jgi:hypothetical protein
MTELECQIEQDDRNDFILYIVVQRALEERKRLFTDKQNFERKHTSVCVQNFVAQCETLAHQIPR